MKIAKKNHTLAKQIIKYFLIIIFSMVLLNAFSSFTFRSFYGNIYDMLKRLVDVYSISQQVGVLYEGVNAYTATGSVEGIARYDNKIAALKKFVNYLRNNSSGEMKFSFIEMENMVSTFDEKSKKIVLDYDRKVAQVYIIESVAELNRLKGYIDDEAKNILVMQIGVILKYYEGFWSDIENKEIIRYLITALITILCIFVAVRFSKQISNPIQQLVSRLQKVAKGQFDVGNIDLKTNDEINVLIESFNFMTLKIKNLIEEIKAKADVETELKEEQIKNLEMTNLLNQSELKFLQSQINPHFLYNTMNTIAALASIEGADYTKKMIDSISDILKYNLKKLNENVTLMEEYRIVESYLYIQQARFGERIEYSLNYDDRVMDYCVPSMILQPFVENAIIHGLEPKEDRGLLEVDIRDDIDNILIVIRDNGIGMDEETIRGLLNYNSDNKNTAKKGIGVSNVIRRLDIRYGKRVVNIKSASGFGTEINICLPKAV